MRVRIGWLGAIVVAASLLPAAASAQITQGRLTGLVTDTQGAVLGKKVAHYLEKHYFQPVQRSGFISRTQLIANR